MRSRLISLSDHTPSLTLMCATLRCYYYLRWYGPRSEWNAYCERCGGITIIGAQSTPRCAVCCRQATLNSNTQQYYCGYCNDSPSCEDESQDDSDEKEGNSPPPRNVRRSSRIAAQSGSNAGSSERPIVID